MKTYVSRLPLGLRTHLLAFAQHELDRMNKASGGLPFLRRHIECHGVYKTLKGIVRDNRIAALDPHVALIRASMSVFWYIVKVHAYTPHEINTLVAEYVREDSMHL